MARNNAQSAGELGARTGIHGVLDDDVSEVLRETFFAPEVSLVESARAQIRRGNRSAEAAPGADRPGPAKAKPEHYKVICISLYTEDLERLDNIVRDLKRRGHTKANRSAVLREAMQQFDPAKVRRGM